MKLTRMNMKGVIINFIIGIVCLVLDSYFINNLFFEVIIVLLLTEREYGIKTIKSVVLNWEYITTEGKYELLFTFGGAILVYSLVCIIIKKPINIIIYIIIYIGFGIIHYKHIDDVYHY